MYTIYEWKMQKRSSQSLKFDGHLNTNVRTFCCDLICWRWFERSEKASEASQRVSSSSQRPLFYTCGRSNVYVDVHVVFILPWVVPNLFRWTFLVHGHIRGSAYMTVRAVEFCFTMCRDVLIIVPYQALLPPSPI